MVNKMNLLYSALVILFLIALLFAIICIIKKMLLSFKNGRPLLSKSIISIFSCLLLLTCMFYMADYIYPFERKLNPELVTVVEIPPQHSPKGPNGCWEWYSVYEEYGLYLGSRFFTAENYYYYRGHIVDEWPEYDLENYTYIITFCQEIDTLTYNVWETVDYPIRTGAKDGHMTFKEEIHPTKIYIYRIPKMRIDNDNL